MCDQWKMADGNIGWIYKRIPPAKLDYQWEVVRGPQHSIFTGPRIDHPRKSIYGKYLYAAGLK